MAVALTAAPGASLTRLMAAGIPLTVVALLVREGNRALDALQRLVTVRLPEMGGEMSLFLAAGVPSGGMAGVIAALDDGRESLRERGGPLTVQ